MTRRAIPGAHWACDHLELDQDEDVTGEEQGRLDDLAAVDSAPIAKTWCVGFKTEKFETVQG
jgi:hypothetical protein